MFYYLALTYSLYFKYSLNSRDLSYLANGLIETRNALLYGDSSTYSIIYSPQRVTSKDLSEDHDAYLLIAKVKEFTLDNLQCFLKEEGTATIKFLFELETYVLSIYSVKEKLLEIENEISNIKSKVRDNITYQTIFSGFIKNFIAEYPFLATDGDKQITELSRILYLRDLFLRMISQNGKLFESGKKEFKTLFKEKAYKKETITVDLPLTKEKFEEQGLFEISENPFLKNSKLKINYDIEKKKWSLQLKGLDEYTEIALDGIVEEPGDFYIFRNRMQIFVVGEKWYCSSLFWCFVCVSGFFGLIVFDIILE